MNNYISMEFLKLKHSRINKIMLSSGILTSLFTIIWFLTSSSLDVKTVLGTFQNNFSIIWIFILTFVLVIEKIYQERKAGNFFNVRSTVLNHRKYIHSLMISLYWVFFKTLLVYELISYVSSIMLYGLDPFKYISLLILPSLFIMLYAVWLIPLMYVIVRKLGVFVGGLITFFMAIMAIILPPMVTPWSLFTTTISNISGIARNGISLGESDHSLIIVSGVVFLIIICIYELVIAYSNRGDKQ